MCGISGIYNPHNKEINSQKITEKILNIQKKRGPDGQGIWRSDCKKITLGHNRLSIIDLSNNASQPFVSKDNKTVITFNGEIYNFNELRSELIKKNIYFKSKSDTEVILEAYKYWGLDCLNKFRGMFSFAIWDNEDKKIVLARDPFGIKPLYYCMFNEVLYFASEIKSLLSIENLSFNLSNLGIVSYYLWGNIQDPFTLYKEIKSLDKGSCLIIKDENKKIFNYASIEEEILNAEEKKFKNIYEKEEYLKEITKETVDYHHVSDVPRTLLLSSGIDSNILLSSMSESNKKNCSALTLDFNFEGKMNETVLATESAKINNINHSSEIVSEDEYVKLIDVFFKNMDSPTDDGLNNFLISNIAKKQNSKIIISGIGGDELFFGYPSFNYIPKLNSFLKIFPDIKIINSFFENHLYKFLKTKKLNMKYSGIFKYGRNLNSAFLLKRSLFLPQEIKELISKKEFKDGYEELNFFDNSLNEIEKIKDKKLSIMYLEIKYYLCSKLLRDSDWASMSNSVELRTPFVDWFYFKKILPLIKFDKNFGKMNLFNAFKNKLPVNLSNRQKTGFVIPHSSFMNKMSLPRKYSNPLKDWAIFGLNKYMKNV